MAQYVSERARMNLLPPSFSSPSALPTSNTFASTSLSSPSDSPVSRTSALTATTDDRVPVDKKTPRSSVLSRRSLSSDATAVELELDLEDGEREGGRLSMFMDFGSSSKKLGLEESGTRYVFFPF